MVKTLIAEVLSSGYNQVSQGQVIVTALCLYMGATETEHHKGDQGDKNRLILKYRFHLRFDYNFMIS